MTAGIVRWVGVMFVTWLTAASSVDTAVLEAKVERADVPVLLVPGWFDTGRDMAALRIRLIAAGWEADHVQTVTFSDPVGTSWARRSIRCYRAPALTNWTSWHTPWVDSRPGGI